MRYSVERIAEDQPGGWKYHLGDALGSVRQLVDQSGDVALAREYSPYGEVASSAGAGSSTFGFASEQSDLTGLTYLRARFYSPYLNQWIQADPIVSDPYTPAAWNRYAYVRNNPVNSSDPTGLCDENDAACVELARDLYMEYGWYPAGLWTSDEVRALSSAAGRIEAWLEAHGGNGSARMRGAMAPSVIVKDLGPFYWIFRASHTFLQTVYLAPGWSESVVVREMAHVTDNLNGTSLLSSLFGGGPSDDMANALGIDDNMLATFCRTRFLCALDGTSHATIILMTGAEDPPSDYALRGPSEDFAVTFTESVYRPTNLANIAPIRSAWMADFAASLDRSRPPFERSLYAGIRVPQPVPTPQCSVPVELLLGGV